MNPATDLPDYDPDLDLVLVRELNAPRELIWECWTSPEHIPHWYVPKPHKVKDIRIDLRPGGASESVFEVEGKEYPQRGVYLEVDAPRRLVFTDTYTAGWKPNPEPFMTAILTFEDLGNGRTRYTAIARHRSKEAAVKHEEMGFSGGWGTVAGQLEEYAQGLRKERGK
jgi:uncharacterized protein YndB with AHSA1/START domain